jgi:hypothetical protein
MLIIESTLNPQAVQLLDQLLESRPPFHFVGIGGAGMSALALGLKHQGFSVSGSDVQDSSTLAHLIQKGINAVVGHRTENVPQDCDKAKEKDTQKPTQEQGKDDPNDPRRRKRDQGQER